MSTLSNIYRHRVSHTIAPDYHMRYDAFMADIVTSQTQVLSTKWRFYFIASLLVQFVTLVILGFLPAITSGPLTFFGDYTLLILLLSSLVPLLVGLFSLIVSVVLLKIHTYTKKWKQFLWLNFIMSVGVGLLVLYPIISYPMTEFTPEYQEKRGYI